MDKDPGPLGRWLARAARGPGNLPYTTARVKARRARLIPPDSYQKLLLMDLNQVVQQMTETGYRREIDELSGKYTGADLVEYALNRNMARSFHEVLDMSTGTLHDNIGHYLGRWDVINIKAVLRGNLYNARPSEIMESVVPAGVYSEDYFAKLATLESVEETAETLGETPYGPTLAGAMPGFKKDGRLAPVEMALERYYYRELLEGTKASGGADELFHKFIRYRIDFENLKNLFRMKARGLGEDVVSPYMLDGGEQTTRRMLSEAMKAQDIDGLLDACRRLTYYSKLREAVTVYREKESFYPVTSLLERTFLNISRDFSYRYPLTILPVMDYMIRKENEVRNLRAIARGKAAKLPKSEIETMLLV